MGAAASNPQQALAAPDAAGAGAHGFQDGRLVDGVQEGVVLGLVVCLVAVVCSLEWRFSSVAMCFG